MKNDYVAFIRNERQILFYYGLFHSKSAGSSDKEFSSLTLAEELAPNGHFYELTAIWEHQKIKLLSQPVNIENGLKSCNIGITDSLAVNTAPYLTVLKSLQSTPGFTKEAYQYAISRLPEYPADGIDVSAGFIADLKTKEHGFGRKADNTTEDFNEELLICQRTEDTARPDCVHGAAGE